MDLTPYYGFDEDAVHFHQTCKDALSDFGTTKYPRFKKWCDEYFFLKHRNEPRGVGGIFFDDFSELGQDRSFAMLQSVGDAFLQAYLPIAERRKDMSYTQRERGLPAVPPRALCGVQPGVGPGTHFGLQSGGRTESILLSMPPHASWSYQHVAAAGSPEEALTSHFLTARDWV